MPTLHSARIWLDFGIKEDNTADLADGDVVIVCVPAPCAGTIKSVKVCCDVLATDADLTLEKAVGAVDVSVLAATCTLEDLTANVASSLTLASTANALHLGATDMLRATWTLTDIEATTDGFGCLVELEPDTW